jgi:hypothetical protein
MGIYILWLSKFKLGLWCLTPLSTIFQLYRGGFYLVSIVVIYIFKYQEMCGSDHMVAGFTTTCAKSKNTLGWMDIEARHFSFILIPKNHQIRIQYIVMKASKLQVQSEDIASECCFLYVIFWINRNYFPFQTTWFFVGVCVVKRFLSTQTPGLGGTNIN